MKNENYAETVTCAEMRKIERLASEGGLSYSKMMENAGEAAAVYVASYIHNSMETEKDVDIVIFCGKGNNGGDGYVAAQTLAVMGFAVTVVMVEGNPDSVEAVKNANIVLRRGIPVIDARAYFYTLPEIVEAADIVIDAIFGIGFHGNLSETARDCTKLINQKCRMKNAEIPKKVFSLDIPSGLSGDLGQPDDEAIIADYTIAFHRKKPVHSMEEMSKYCGEIKVVGIGIKEKEGCKE